MTKTQVTRSGQFIFLLFEWEGGRNLQSVHIALQPSVSSNAHPKPRALMDLLKQVDQAYGKPATAFRDTVLEVWTGIGRRWPSTGTKQYDFLGGIFHKLCVSLHATRGRARAGHWSEEELQKHLTAELVSSVGYLHFCYCAELMFHPP